MTGEEQPRKARTPVGAARKLGHHVLGGRAQARSSRQLTELAVAEHDDPEAAARGLNKVKNHQLARRGIAAGSIVTLAAGAWFWLSRGGDTTTTTVQAGVVKVVPEAIDLRAMIQSGIEERARYVQKDAVSKFLDHIPLVGAVSREIERSQGGTATFTGVNGTGNGEIDTLVGFKPGGITEKRLGGGRVEMDIPTSSVVLLNAVNEQRSRVTWNPGDLAALRSAEATIFDVGGITNGVKARLETGQAAVEAEAREAAINEAATSCATAAWPLAERAATAAYRGIAVQQYHNEIAEGRHLRPFVASDLTVHFVGRMPHFNSPEKLTSNVTVSAANATGCSVASNAYDPKAPATGSYMNAFGETVPTAVGG